MLHEIANTDDGAQRLHQRAVLCIKVNNVREVNSAVLKEVPGSECTFLSDTHVDTVGSDPELCTGHEPTHRSRLEAGLSDQRWLQSLKDSSVPDHSLVLKRNCLCFLMRNLSLDDKAMNNTKVQVLSTRKQRPTGKHTKNYLLVRVLATGEYFFVPRVTFHFRTECGTRVARKQYPLRLAYAMTVNRSQGQTLDKVCLDLRAPPFSHGQLYVALSRVRKKGNLIILTLPEYAALLKHNEKRKGKDGKKRKKLGLASMGTAREFRGYTYNIVYEKLLR